MEKETLLSQSAIFSALPADVQAGLLSRFDHIVNETMSLNTLGRLHGTHLSFLHERIKHLECIQAITQFPPAP